MDRQRFQKNTSMSNSTIATRNIPHQDKQPPSAEK
jgi:hypothetical protein